ncbi:MAG: S49 family peptidase [Phycisphaerales bacterium]|nr:S49 family peptidase [Phycisphaerales bacterium]
MTQRRRISAVLLLSLAAWVLGDAATTRGETAEGTHHATSNALPAALGESVPGAIITIHGEISDVTTESLRRRIKMARDEGARVIVFELDTPGGMVSSALDICAMIKNLTDIKTVAWVNTDAYSAGSMISMACDEIVMSSSSVIGDCGVILGGPTGPQEVPEALRAKAESPVIEQFQDSAARNGYDPLLCESLVVKEIVVYWVENTKTGERRFIDEAEKEKLFGEDTEGFQADDEEQSGPNEWKLIKSYVDPVSKRKIDFSQPIVKDTQLLTMSQSRATAFGFCKAIVSTPQELAARYNIAGEWAHFDFSWSENLTGWLTSMPVRIFLLVIILLGAYVEFHTPGVGVPGLVALIALGIFVGAPYLTGLANVWEIVIILIGFLLLALEIFVIPGFGIAGISGIMCVIVGLLATFMPDEPGRTFPIYWPQLEPGVKGLESGVVVLASGAAAGVVAMIIFSRVLPHIPWLQSAIPLNPTRVDTGPSTDPYHGYARVGDIGTVVSTLRPAGKARFGDELVDVVTLGDYIEPPADVRVVERAGNRVVVAKYQSSGQEA